MYLYPFVGVGVRVESVSEKLGWNYEDFVHKELEKKITSGELPRFLSKDSIENPDKMCLVSGENTKVDYLAIPINRDATEGALEGMDVKEIQYIDIIQYKKQLVDAILEMFKIEIYPEDVHYISGSFLV